MSVDCEYPQRAYMFSGHPLSVLSSKPYLVYEAVIIRKKVSLSYYRNDFFDRILRENFSFEDLSLNLIVTDRFCDITLDAQ